MEIALRDENYVPGTLAVLNTDSVQGTNLVAISMDGGDLSVDEVATISFTMQPVTPQDANYVNVLLFEGSDGLLYPAVATSAGALLIDTGEDIPGPS